MSYKFTEAKDAVTYEPAGHYDVRCTRLHNPEDVDGRITLGLSHFLPGGGAEMAKAPVELIYYVIEGEMTVTTEDGEIYVLRNGDSMHFSPEQGRKSENTGIVTAKMLVIAAK